MRCRGFAHVAATGVVLAFHVRGGASEPSPEAVRAAVQKSIPRLESGTIGSAEGRKCFTCHSQAIPVFALAEAKSRGFGIDEENFERQLEHTEAHLDRGRIAYAEGRGQGGTVLTAGYALWTLEAGGRTPDDLTAAVTSYLLEYQKDDGHWSHRGTRPPSSGSDFTATYVALRGLAYFGTDAQKPLIEARFAQAADWLASEPPCDTEDCVFRLWALPYVHASGEAIQAAIAQLIDTQREDGGWAQTSDMESDVYATGTALVALLDAGGLSTDHHAVRRGVRYLLDTQLDDGTWHVVSRADPFQTYFESGFPHGKDQFISITASSWATLALLRTLSE